MAEEIQIRGSGARAKIRNPLGVVGLSLITIGIYFFCWWYFINREMKDLGQARGRDLGQSPGNSLLAMALGWIIIVPPIVSEWRTSTRIQDSQETVGRKPHRLGADHLHPAFPDRPRRRLVRAARAEQGVGGGALRRRRAGDCRRPVVRRAAAGARSAPARRLDRQPRVRAASLEARSGLALRALVEVHTGSVVLLWGEPAKALSDHLDHGRFLVFAFWVPL